MEEKLTDPALGLMLIKQKESETCIEFLDIRINICAGEYLLSTFRKETYIPLFIKANSKEPWHFKMAAFKALLQRIDTHCTSMDSKNKELMWINNQAIKHGYSNKIVPRLWKNLLKRKNARKRNDPKKEGLPMYSLQINDVTLKFKKKLERITGQKITFNRRNTLFNIIRNDKDKIDPHYFPGVYEIPVYDREAQKNAKYIGYTCRSLRKRIPEHIRDVRNNAPTTSLAQHAMITDLQVEWDNAKLLSKHEDPRKGKIAEALTIYKERNKKVKPINKIDPSTINNAWKWCMTKN